MSFWKQLFGSGSANTSASAKADSAPASKQGISADDQARALFDTYKKLRVSEEDNKKGIAILTEILGMLDLNTTKLHPGVVFYQRAMRYKFLENFDAALKDLDQALLFAEQRGDQMLESDCHKYNEEIRQSKNRAEIESSGGEKATKFREMEAQREVACYNSGSDANAAFAALFEDLSNPDSDVRLNASRILADSNTTLMQLVSIYKECLNSDVSRAHLAGRVLGRKLARGGAELIAPRSAELIYGLNCSVLPCSCVHCGFMNLGIAAPARGIEVPYYHQDNDKAAYSISVICDKCSRKFFVIWDTDPR